MMVVPFNQITKFTLQNKMKMLWFFLTRNRCNYNRSPLSLKNILKFQLFIMTTILTKLFSKAESFSVFSCFFLFFLVDNFLRIGVCVYAYECVFMWVVSVSLLNFIYGNFLSLFLRTNQRLSYWSISCDQSLV